jgi:hypothetical protein
MYRKRSKQFDHHLNTLYSSTEAFIILNYTSIPRYRTYRKIFTLSKSTATLSNSDIYLWQVAGHRMVIYVPGIIVFVEGPGQPCWPRPAELGDPACSRSARPPPEVDSCRESGFKQVYILYVYSSMSNSLVRKSILCGKNCCWKCYDNYLA